MVTCNSCGYEYESKVLQTPDEETLVSEPHKDIMEMCPKCNQISSYSGPDYYWEQTQLWLLDTNGLAANKSELMNSQYIILQFISYFLMTMRDKSSDIDVIMYTPFSCVDCNRRFQTRQELDEHELVSD